MALAVLLTSPALAQRSKRPGDTEGTVKRFLFDASNSSNFAAQGIQFSRPVATLDPPGNAVAAGAPRFDHPVLLPTIGVPQLIPVGQNTLADGLLLASGVDRDGVTPLMVYLHYDNDWLGGADETLYVFSGGDVPASWDPLSPGHTRTVLHTRTARQNVVRVPCVPAPPTYSFADLFNGEWTTPSGAAKALRVCDGAVFHGAIVLAGAVYVYNGAAVPAGYEVRGWGFALSNDRGATWTLIGDDIHEPALPNDQVLWPRGGIFCMSAAPIYQRGVAHPSECWFSSSDYRFNDCGTGAEVGRAFVLRLSRPGGNPGVDWQAGPVTYFELSGTLNHIHACQITEYGAPNAPQGLQIVAAIGDGQNRNRFARWVLPDKSLDYSVPGNWAPPPLTNENYHGSRSDPTQSPPLPGTLSSQPTAAAFGPTPGTILWGSDTMAEWISLMQLPLSGAGQSQFHQIYGMAVSAGADSTWAPGEHLLPLCKPMRGPRPEAGGPMLCILNPAIGAVTPTRIMYCPSIADQSDTWTQVVGLHQGSATTLLYGGSIYYTSEISTFGLWRQPEPFTRSFRPMVVGPGGTNLVTAGSYFDSNGPGLVEPLTPGANPGEWVDHGRVVRPPVMSDRVYRIVTSRAAGSNFVATLRPSTTLQDGQAGAWAEPNLTWFDSKDVYERDIQRVRRARGWLLDGTYNDGANTTGTTPNKTSRLSVSLRAGDTPTNSAWTEVRYSCGDRWCPATIIARRAITSASPSPGLGLSLDTATADDNYMYFALDQAMDGNGSLGYPQPPQSGGGGGAPVQAPDEQLSVSPLGLNCTRSWRFRIAGMQPMGNWDQYSERGHQSNGVWISDRRWPLFTLWAGPDSYIEFQADCEHRGSVVKAKAPGQPVRTASFGDGVQVWLPESPLLIVIAFDAAHGKLYVGSSVGGDIVRSAALDVGPGWAPNLTFDTLRFSGSGGGVLGSRPEVVEYRWIGGEADSSPVIPPTLDGLGTAFTDLNFLGGR